MRTLICSLGAVLTAGALAAGARTLSGQTSQTRTIYVSAVDSKEAPVIGLAPGDLVIKEEGKTREIVAVEPTKTPMQIVLMLDDSGLGLRDIRQGAGQFIEILQGRAEFAIITMAGRNLPLVDFTADPPTLFAGLQKMLTRNVPSTYILDGLVEVAQTLQRRQAPRPVIVLVAVEGEELSSARADVVQGALQRSGARLYYIGLGAPVTQGTRPAYGAARAADSTEDEAGKRNAVLGSAPKNSGGRSEQILQSSGLPGLLKQIANELAGQYAVTYRSDVTEAKISVETSKKGVKLRAPARVGSR